MSMLRGQRRAAPSQAHKFRVVPCFLARIPPDSLSFPFTSSFFLYLPAKIQTRRKSSGGWAAGGGGGLTGLRAPSLPSPLDNGQEAATAGCAGRRGCGGGGEQADPVVERLWDFVKRGCARQKQRPSALCSHRLFGADFGSDNRVWRPQWGRFDPIEPWLLLYECLVEGCGVKLKSYKSRQQHLIDKHQFPKSFEFFKKARPSQRHRQKSHRRQTAHKGEENKDNSMDVDGKATRQTNWRYRPKQHDHKESKENERQHQETKENEMEVEQTINELTSAVSKLSTADSTPANVTFGHRRSRGLTFVPRSIRQNKHAGSQPEAK